MTDLINPPHTDQTPGMLRDLTDADFRARYGCDRFSATVLANRLRYAVQHMATGLRHRAFSPIIASMFDFATAICGPPSSDYAMAAVNNGLLVFLGTMQDGVRNAVEEFGPHLLEPGDILVCNDPNRIGNHVNDLLLVAPSFDGDRLLGFVVIKAHQFDMGGTVPGGFGSGKRNVYETGLVLGPQLLYRRGEPVASTFSLIFDNARFGRMLFADLQTTRESLALGEHLLNDTILRYGVDAYLGTLRYACDASAEAMRTALRRLPDGDYAGEGLIDCDAAGDDEEYFVNVRLVKRGERVEVDLSGSSRQARTCINASPLDTKTGVAVALKVLLDPQAPFTSGAFRPVDVVIPPGSVTGALPPDGAVFFYWEIQSAMMCAILQALRHMLGEDAIAGDLGSTTGHNANGVLEDGTPWLSTGQTGGEFGAWGGTREGDGDGYSTIYFVNILAPPTEVIEHASPAMIMRKEYVADTPGAGVNRGGPSVCKDVLWSAAGDHYTTPMRLKRPSGVGVRGGADGTQGGIWIFEDIAEPGEAVRGTDEASFTETTVVAGKVDPATHAPSADGEFAYYGREDVWRRPAGTMWRYITNAGGGWGNPIERDPERVKRDVRDGYVTIEGALRDYGVVITGDPERHPEQLVLDAEATRRARADRA
jgi:N-methylhydantoinase B